MNNLNELRELLAEWAEHIPSDQFEVSVRAVEPSNNFRINQPVVYADITPLEDMNNTLVVKAWIIGAEQSESTNIKSRSGIVRFMMYSENASSLVGFNENPLLCVEARNIPLTIKARLSVLHQSITQAYAGDEGMFAKNVARAFVEKSIEHQWAKDLFVYDINAMEGVFDALRKHVDDWDFVKSIEVKNSGNSEHSSFNLIRRNYHFLTENTSIPLESTQGLVCLKINEDTQRQIKTLDAGKIFDALVAFCSGGLDDFNEFDYVGTPSNSLPEEAEKTGIEAKDPDNDKRLAESAKEQEELQKGLFAVAAAAVTPHSAIPRRNTLSIHNDAWGDNRSATITAKSPRKVGNVHPCLIMKITENKSEEKMEVEAVLSDSLPDNGRKIVTHSVYASEFPQDEYTIFYEIVSTLNVFNTVIAGTSASDGISDVAEMLARRKEETLADHSLNITRRIANAGELHRVLATYAHWTADRDPRFTIKALGFGDFQSTTIRNGVKKLSITTPSDNADDAKAVLEISGVRRVEVTRPTYKEARDEIALMIEELD
jgi:hypothetical protein